MPPSRKTLARWAKPVRWEKKSGGASGLPVSAAQISSHFEALGLSGDDVSSVEPYIRAAALEVEDFAGLALLTTPIHLHLDTWPSEAQGDDWHEGVREMPVTRYREPSNINLPLGPLRSDAAVSVFVIDQDFEETELNASDFRIQAGRYPVLLVKPGTEAASLLAVDGGSVRVEYSPGYGGADTDVPADLSLAVLDQAVRLHERRGDETGEGLGMSPHAKRIAARYAKVRV
jgi:uncharacterized phiE125 gp8 family phage protein